MRPLPTSWKRPVSPGGGLYGHFRSKEEIWYAAYEECTRVWKNIVFNGIGEISDPLERIQRIIENSMRDYLGGGCGLRGAVSCSIAR